MNNTQSSSWINDKTFNEKAESWLDLFHQNVEKKPEKKALSFENESYSYERLNSMANSFAAEILGKSNKDDQFVGICMDRSPAMLAAMIGVHKTGKAYLPLESTFPAFRLNHMISDSGTNLIITDNAKQLSGSLGNSLELFYIDSNKIQAGREVAVSNPGKEDYSYIMYTSGSTGLPKGVVISHGAFLNFLLSMKEEPGCSPIDHILALTTISFDISGLELFLPLISGASIELVSKEAVFNPSELIEKIHQSGVTMIQTTPTVWKLMLDSGFSGSSKIKILCGGEALTKDLANELFNTGCQVWNMYGPTETTIWSSLHKVESELTTAPSIGMPIANTGLFILTEDMKPVEKGETGQLWISGEGLAKGYWNRKELNDKAFCLNPDMGNLRIYQTGDMVYECPKGEIRYVGRKDHQVKIRGLRLEIDEIEQAIRDITEVKEVVVLPRTDHQDNRILVAFYMGESETGKISHKTFRTILSEKLPDYMVPSYFQMMVDFPMTLNNKIDRSAFPEITFDDKPELEIQIDALKETIFNLWSRHLNRSDFTYKDNFFDIGGHSLLVIQITKELSNILNADIKPMFFFQHPTINSQYEKLSGYDEKTDIGEKTESENTPQEEDEFSLAVIGVSCAVPGAENATEFWELLESGSSGIKEFTDDELIAEGVSRERLNSGNYVKKSGALSSCKYFDSQFFGYSPKEARFMDPQHRLMLEHCHKALESAGIKTKNYPGKIGVFASSGQNRYLLKNIMFSSERKEWSDFQTMIGNEDDFLSSRIAYKNDLKGPAITVQTACSSSLVAVQLAYQSLLSYQSDMAICGGVSLNIPLNEGYSHEEAAILSPDGKCRAFDAEASGTIFGSGIGVVILKRLNEAKKDNDPILAVLRSAAINNDGSDKIGFTAPSIKGQADVIRDAHELANISPSQISYVEAHGTATELGDPIEIMALAEAFGDREKRQSPCYIGSVKTNIGHLDAAAGIIGLIKTTLALHNKKIPASLHYKKPNPKMNIEQTPFQVNTELRNWKPIHKRRIAGVSSFGIGGTNAHILLESYNQTKTVPVTDSKVIIYPISAKTSSVLKEYQNEMMQFVERGDDYEKLNTAYTLSEGRNLYNYRSFFTNQTINDESLNSSVQALRNPETVFLFPGQNAQYPGMAKELYSQNITFRTYLDQCLDLIERETGWNSRKLIHDLQINNTEYTQPLLFATEWALGKTLIKYGIPIDYLTGHSLGEYSAACLAGAFSIEDGLKIVINRGKIMSQAPAGRMLVASTNQEEIKGHIPIGVEIAAINSPKQIVFSGLEKQIISFEKTLKELNIPNKLLQTESAFHSHLMDSILPDFRESLTNVTFFPLEKTVISNLTGEILEPGFQYDAEYWIKHLRNSVLFKKGIESLKNKNELVYIEVGPGKVLSNLVKSIITTKDTYSIQTIPQFKSTENDHHFFMKSLGKVWRSGIEIDLGKINKIKNGCRIAIPTYPFEKKEHWIYPENTPDGSSIKKTAKKKAETTIIITDDISAPMQQLSNIWKKVLGYSEIKPDQNFFDLGGDSLLASELLNQINGTFNINLQLRDILLYPVLNDMADIIKSATNSLEQEERNFPILFPVQTKGDLVPLFLVAGAHENRYYNEETRESSYEEDFLRYFSSLISFLGKNQPIYGFRPRGIFWGEKYHKNVSEMAVAYIKELKKVQPEGPYVIGGECVGGSVAIEIAQQLTQNGDIVKHLILMDTPRPGFRTSFREEYNSIRNRLKKIIKREDKRPFLNALSNELKRLVKIYFPITKKQRAIIHVSESSLYYQRILLQYNVKKYDGNVTLIINDEWNNFKPNLNWNKTIFPKLNVHVVPGNHSTRLSKYGNISGEIINKKIKESI